MTEQDLRQALGAFGTVISVRILRDPHKQSRGVGFARMSDREQCQEIINQFNNKTFPSLFFLPRTKHLFIFKQIDLIRFFC